MSRTAVFYIIILALFFVLFTSKLSYGAQYSTLRWQRQPITQDISSYFLSFTQTQDGFYWLGGTSGLVRFDSLSFESIRFIDAQDKGLEVSPTVLSMAQGEQNQLWLGTTYGLYHYDPASHVAKPVAAVEVTPIKQLWYDGFKLYGLSFSEGAFALDTQDLSQPPHRYHLDKKSTAYSELAVNQHYVFLLGKDNHIEVFERQSNRLVALRPTDGDYHRIHIFSETILLSGKGNTLARLALSDWVVSQINLGTINFDEAVKSGDDQLLLRTSGNQLLRFNITTEHLQSLGPISSQRGQPINDELRQMVRDNTGQFWLLGKGANALYRQDNISGQFALQPFSGSTPTLIYDLLFDEAQVLYSASDVGLFAQADANQPHQLVYPGHFTGILARSDDHLWLVDDKRQLGLLSLSNGRFEPLQSPACRTLLSEPIFIYPAKDHGWLVFDSKQGVIAVRNMACRLLVNYFYPQDSRNQKAVHAIAVLAPETFLISSRWGLYEYRVGQKQMVSWQKQFGPPFNRKPILTFSRAWGGLLMSEHGGALISYFAANDEVKVLDFTPLLGDHVVAISAIEGSGLVIGSERGIYLHQPGFDRFWPLSGLLGGEALNRQQVALSPTEVALVVDSHVYRQSIDRLAATPLPQPRAYLKELRVNQQLQLPGSDNPYLKRSLANTHTLELSHLDEFVSFTVSATGAGQQPFDFQYRLLGLSEQWITLNDTNRFRFNSLKAGSYVLELRTSNRLGAVSSVSGRLNLEVKPPPWWSWQAILLYWLSAVLMVRWLFIHQKNRYLSTQQQLEKMVRERTLSLDEALAELQLGAEQIKLLLKQKELLLQDKDTMLFAISHELKTPLATLDAPLQLLADGQGEVGQVLPLMQRSTDRLKRFVDQILLLAKLGEQAPLQKQRLPLGTLVNHLVLSYQDFAKRHKVELVCELDLHIECEGAIQPLEIMISNLLANAINHGQCGKQVSVMLSLEQRSAVLMVTDFGKGMDEQTKANLFKPFMLSSQSGPNSSGLGMALVKQIVQAHQGTIEVFSAPGQGCRIRVSLPCCQQAHSDKSVADVVLSPASLVTEPLATAPAAVQPLATETAASMPHTNKAQLLVVDDDADVLTLLQVILAEHYELRIAHGGEQAKALLQEHPIALVLTDFHMPDSNGTELTDWIKSNPATSHIPVIMMSADIASNTAQNALVHLAEVFISKPFDYQLLLAQIHSLVQNRARITATSLVSWPLDDLGPHDEQLAPVDRRFMASLHQVLENHYRDPEFKLSDVLDVFAMSERNLRYKVNALTGESPTAYLYQFRIEKAKLQLQSELSLEEIATINGFKNLRQFRSRFVEYLGISPSEMRAKLG